MTEAADVSEQAPAEVPDGIVDAVDMLVDEFGVDGAEERLQVKFRDRHEKAIAALGYLRFQYREVDE